MSDDYPRDLREAFLQFDRDKNGLIDREEFGLLLALLGSDMSDQEIDVGFQLIDEDDTGTISLPELAKWWEVVREEGQ